MCTRSRRALSEYNANRREKILLAYCTLLQLCTAHNTKHRHQRCHMLNKENRDRTMHPGNTQQLHSVTGQCDTETNITFVAVAVYTCCKIEMLPSSSEK